MKEIHQFQNTVINDHSTITGTQKQANAVMKQINTHLTASVAHEF